MGDGIPIDIENGIPIPIIRLMLIHFSFSWSVFRLGMLITTIGNEEQDVLKVNVAGSQ